LADIRLRDIALLSSQFEVQAGVDEGDVADEYPDEQVLQLRPDVQHDDEQFICFIDGQLDHESFPFTLSFTMGFLFTVSDAEQQTLGPEELRPTLTWLAFPYIREYIADVTSRAPIPTYFIPPMTRLPHPGQVEGAADLRGPESHDEEEGSTPAGDEA
jgi:hypothetical protein